MVNLAPHTIILEHGTPEFSGITVAVSVYNYEKLVCETLDTVRAQTFDPLSLVIVEDRGADRSVDVCTSWIKDAKSRFAYCTLVQHEKNAGLAQSRNTAFSLATTPYVFVLDADNHLYSRCLQRCFDTLEHNEAAFAYTMIEKFGDASGLMGNELWCKDRLSHFNYIDAMSLIRKSAWLEASGYEKMPITGWEDYDLWCKMVELGMRGIRIPEILARYRGHSSSMLNTITNVGSNAEALRRLMKERHPWLKV